MAEETMMDAGLCEHDWTDVLPSGYVLSAVYCRKCGDVSTGETDE